MSDEFHRLFEAAAGFPLPQRVVNTPEMLQVLCANPVSWVISPADYIENNARLQSLQPIARNKLYVLLRIPSSYAPLECR